MDENCALDENRAFKDAADIHQQTRGLLESAASARNLDKSIKDKCPLAQLSSEVDRTTIDFDLLCNL